ncbi:MAG: hypothetical protein WCQ95_02765 [Bacteroidota bacterium]
MHIAHYNTSGQYDTMLTETETAHNAYYGEINNEDVTLALRKSHTLSVDITITNLKLDIRKDESTIKSKFFSDTPTYLEVFPRGLNEYNIANKTNIEILLNRLKHFGTTHALSFDSAFVTKLTGYLTNYLAARGPQLATKQDTKDLILTTAQIRTALEHQITKNILTLALANITTPEVAQAFFNQKLLHPTHHHPQGDQNTGEYILPVLANQTALADFTLQNQPDYYLLLANTGATVLQAYTCDHITGLPIPLSMIELLPGTEKVFSYAELGARSYLFFINPSPDTDGEISITQLDTPTV